MWYNYTIYTLKKEKEKNMQENEQIYHLKGVNVEKALELTGSMELFLEILEEYYSIIPRKSRKLTDLYQAENWQDYTIEVHSLKSTSRQVGIMELGDFAYEIELAGKAGDIEKIQALHGKLMEWYLSYQEILAPLFPNKEEEELGKEQMNPTQLEEFLTQMLEACDELDMDAMDAVIEQMSKYRYEDRDRDLFMEMKDAVEELDSERIEGLVEMWRA